MSSLLLLKRLFRDKLALVSSVALILLIVFSFFGRTFLLDGTENANRQIPAIPLLKSGKTVSFLKILHKDQREEWIPVSFSEDQGSVIRYGEIQNSEGAFLEKSIHRTEIASFSTAKHSFLLGTDVLGRDIFSRLILGLRISIIVGFMSMIISLVVGVIVGSLAGYFGGWLDDVIMLFINSLWSIPTLLFVFALVLVFGRGMSNIYLAVGLTMWVEVARVSRSMVMKIKQENYVTVGRALAFKNKRILTRHILPNIVDPLTVLAATNFATAILVEAGLSYLGFGVKPPTPSVGMILSENYGYVLSGHYIKAMAPAILILILVLSLNLIGNALRDAIDIKTLSR